MAASPAHLAPLVAIMLVLPCLASANEHRSRVARGFQREPLPINRAGERPLSRLLTRSHGAARVRREPRRRLDAAGWKKGWARVTFLS